MTTWIRAYVNPALVSPAAFGDDVYLTTAGGYVVAGSTGVSPYNAWIGKVAAPGQLQWQKKVGCGASNVLPVQQTSDGGYIIAGSTGSIGSSSVLVVQLDASGTIQWQQTYSTGSDYEDTASSVPQAADGGYVVAGQVISQIRPGIRLPDALLLKLTSGGTIQWQDRYDAGDSLSSSVLRTADGGYAIAGSIQLIVDGETETASWLAKTTFTGTISWQHDYYAINASTTRPYPRVFSGLAQADDGGFVAARYTDGYRNSDNVWLVKTDATGNVASCAEARPRHVRGRRRRADGVRVVTSRRGTGYCRSRSQRRHRHHGYSHHPQGLLSDASRAGHHTRNGADDHRHGHAVRPVLAGDISSRGRARTRQVHEESAKGPPADPPDPCPARQCWWSMGNAHNGQRRPLP